jgi:hypothetical protein
LYSPDTTLLGCEYNSLRAFLGVRVLIIDHFFWNENACFLQYFGRILENILLINPKNTHFVAYNDKKRQFFGYILHNYTLTQKQKKTTEDVIATVLAPLTKWV